MKKISIVILMAFFIVSCASSKKQTNFKYGPLTEKYIEKHGVKEFNSDQGRLYKSLTMALGLIGYEVAYQNKEKGLILTKLKTTSFTGSFSGIFSFEASFSAVERKYIVEINKVAKRKYKIKAIPKKYSGGYDISNKDVWVLEGEYSEKVLWDQFLVEVQRQLE